MRESSGLGFGGFLLGIGVGWLIFRNLEVSHENFAYLIIIFGIGIAASALMSGLFPKVPVKGLIGGISGGLILSLFMTSGIGFITEIPGGWVSEGYQVEDTRTFNGILTADNAYLEVDNFNGPIRVQTWDRDEFNIDLKIKARTQKDLDDLKINFEDKVVQGQSRLMLSYDIPLTAQRRYSIEVNVNLPSDASIDLDLDSSNGAIYLTDIRGKSLKIETSNGQLIFEKVIAESIWGKTSNGRVQGQLESKDTYISTSNGKIDVTIPCTVSGLYELITSNGDIELSLSSSSNVGYDLDLSTSNGGLNLGLSDLNYSINKKTEKKAITEGFDFKQIQITLKADTSNGSIDIET